MLPTEKGLSSRPKATTAIRVSSVGLDGESGPSIGWAFFERERPIVIDSNRCLCYLSRNSALKLVTILSSSYSPQIIGGTKQFTFTSISLLKDKENGEDEEDGENGVVKGRILAFWTGQVICFFFFLAGGQIAELDTG